MRNQINTALRSRAMWEKYQEAPKRTDFLENPEEFEVVKEYDYWRIIVNQFPYDNVAEVHHLLAPIEKYATEAQCPEPVAEEIQKILLELDVDDYYDCIMQNFTVAQSIPAHLHYHLLKWKRV